MFKSNYLFHFIVSEAIDAHVNFLRRAFNFKNNRELFENMLDIISINYDDLKGMIGDHKSEYNSIDKDDPRRVDKYVRLKIEKYKILKKWHYKYNEYGMSVILRDIIKFFYEGIVKYGMEEFIKMVTKKFDVKRIRIDLKIFLTHMIRISIRKRIIFSYVIENLSIYT